MNLTWIDPFNNPLINIIIILNYVIYIWLILKLFLNKKVNLVINMFDL